MAIGVACAPTGAAAQAPAPSLPERLSVDTRASIRRLADSLRSAGVPVDPLYDKAAEGVLKNADDARILRAVRSLAGELAAARGALGPTASPADVLAGASAIHAGVPHDALRRLARARRSRGDGASLAVPLTVIADLVTRRVPAEVAIAAVEALVSRGMADDALSALRADVQRDILAGHAPAAAASARTRALVHASRRPEPPGASSLP
jgi:hypothetical protein